MTGPVISRPRSGRSTLPKCPRTAQAGCALKVIIGTLVNGLLGAARQSFAQAGGRERAAQERDMPSSENTESLVLALAAFLFAFALVSLLAWVFKSFVLTGRSGASYLKGRDRRLGVVETASVDAQRKLILIRRDNVEHLIMTGGPVDVLIETGIEGHNQFEQPVGDVMIARSDPQPTPGVGKT
jgi:flagellar protein FliO/FliZ